MVMFYLDIVIILIFETKRSYSWNFTARNSNEGDLTCLMSLKSNKYGEGLGGASEQDRFDTSTMPLLRVHRSYKFKLNQATKHLLYHLDSFILYSIDSPNLNQCDSRMMRTCA